MNNIIELYSHCVLCYKELEELNFFTSPQNYQDISIGLSADKKKMQLWCNRHNENIHVFELANTLDACCDDCAL